MSRASIVLACVALTSLACLPACASGTASPSKDAPPPTPEGGSAATPPTISDECDGAKIASLGQVLAAAAVPDRPELVAKHLPDACRLPQAVTAMLIATSPSDQAGREGINRTHYRAALNEVCPTAGVVTKQVAQASAEDRAGIMFDGCKFDRFDLLSRTDFTREGNNTPIVLYAHHWLMEQGLTKEQAEPISRALLLHARHRWAKPGQQLPPLAHAVRAVPPGPAVHVTTKAVFVADQLLVQLDDTMSPDAAAMQGHLIGPLYDLLAEEADKAKSMHEASGKDGDWDARLVIVADARVPFSTMVSVLYTGGRAEFTRYAVVGESGPLEYGAVPLELPRYRVDTSAGVKSIPALGVAITDSGYDVVAGVGTAAGAPPQTETIALADGSRWDFAALASRASKHHTEHGAATTAYIGPADTVSWGVIVPTMAAVRGKDCDDKPSTCVLPDVVVGASGPAGVPMMARNAKILGLIEDADGHFLASHYGEAFAVGIDEEDVWGGLTGTEVGEAFGKGGLGLVGTGRGGAGTGEGTIGLGNVGLIGKGKGGGTGSGYGRGSGAGFGKPGKRVPRVRQAKAKVDGMLDKDIIRRIVRAHINEVRYCYNQGLVRDPELSGRITVNFTIAATGKVSASTVDSTTLDDDNVANCVAKAIKRWKFPKPTDGGAVSVGYPFVLQPG